MTNHDIDNSCSNLGSVVTWQYDKAYHLLLVIRLLDDLYNACIRDFWNNWMVACLAIDSCSDFGAMVWGTVLGVQRPNVLMTSSSTEPTAVSLSLYRKILKAELYYKSTNGSFADIIKYLSIIFQTSYGQCGVTMVDNRDMSITYEKTQWYDDMEQDQQALFERASDYALHYPLGIKENRVVSERVFGFAGQENTANLYANNVAYNLGDIVGYVEQDGSCFNWECKQSVLAEENTSWDVIKGKFVKTLVGDPFIGSFAEKEQIGYFIQIPDFAADEKRGIIYFSQKYYYSPNIVYRWPDNIHYCVCTYQAESHEETFSFSCLISEKSKSFRLFLEKFSREFKEFFPSQHKAVCEYAAGKDYVDGWDVFYYNKKYWLVTPGVNAEDNTSFEAISNCLLEMWGNTSFICTASKFYKQGSEFDGALKFRDAIEAIVATYNGVNNVVFDPTALCPAYIGDGALVSVVSGNVRSISANLDLAAEQEGKHIYSTATIGDIVRYLNGSLYVS